MPQYSKKDFSEICFTTTSDLSNYIRRGNVIVNSETGLIDSSNELNAAFIVKRKQIQTIKTAKSAVIPDIKSKEKSKEPQSKFDFPPEMQTEVRNNFIKEGEIKSLEVEKSKNAIELQKIDIQKKKGVVIPTSLVKDLFAQYSKSITVSFKNGSENLITEITKRSGLNSKDVAEIRAKLIDIINSSVEEALALSKDGLKIIVDEYVNKRGVGERE